MFPFARLTSFGSLWQPTLTSLGCCWIFIFEIHGWRMTSTSTMVKKSEASEVVGIPEHTVKRKLKLTIFVILNKLLISQKFKNQDHVSSYCWSYSQPVWSQKLPSGCGQDQINTLAEQQNGAGERAFAQILRQKLGQNTHKYQGPTPRNLAPCTGPFLCAPNHWNHNIESVRFQCIMLIVDTFNVSPLGQSKARQTRSFSRNVSDSNHESWHHGVAYKKRMVFSWFSMSWYKRRGHSRTHGYKWVAHSYKKRCGSMGHVLIACDCTVVV